MLKKNVVNIKGTMTNWPGTKTDTQNNTQFLKCFLQKMLSYRLGTVNDFHWGFNPVLSYSKHNTFLTFVEK